MTVALVPAAFLVQALLARDGAAPSRHADPNVLSVCIRSDDGPEAAAAFLDELARQLPDARISAGVSCDAGATPGTRPSATGRFVQDTDGVAFEMWTEGRAATSARRIPWLDDLQNPLATTSLRGKSAAFGLLLESLVADFDGVRLRPLRSPAPARREPPSPGESTAPAVAFGARDRSPAAAPADADAPALREPLSVQVLLPAGGFEWMPPATVAPRLEAGVAFGGARWQAAVHGALALDSTFAIGDRPFDTTGYSVRAGARRVLARSTRAWVDVELALVGHLSRYRRAELAGAVSRRWYDLGAGVYLRGAAQIAGPLYGVLSLGAQVFPTARVVAIPDGPSRRANLVTLAGVLGLGVDF